MRTFIAVYAYVYCYKCVRLLLYVHTFIAINAYIYCYEFKIILICTCFT